MALVSGGPFAEGAIIDDRYRILGQLGKGGMGGVYLAEQIKFGREVALKVLLETAMADTVARKRFVNEAKAVCTLQHPNLVVYHDFGTDPATECMYLVMERLEGRSLAQVLKSEGALSIGRVVHMMTQLSAALSEAHAAGMIHRDLKPANVMLVRRGEDGDFVKLIDFGIAKAVQAADSPNLTQMGVIVGTTGYLAPEYIRDQIVDPRIDVYALGVMCYELIAGHRPFEHIDHISVLRMHLDDEAKSLTQLDDGRFVPPELNAVVMQAMSKDPKQRFQNVGEFRNALTKASAVLMDLDATHTTVQMPEASDELDDPTVQVDLSTLDVEDPRDQGLSDSIATISAEVSDIRKKPIRTDTGMSTSIRGLNKTLTRNWARWVGVAVGCLALALVVLLWPEPPPRNAPPPDVSHADEVDIPKSEPAAASIVLIDEIERREPEDETRQRVTIRSAEQPSVSTAESPKLVPIKVLARPFGTSIYSGKRRLGVVLVKRRVKEGRHCFSAVHPSLGKKRKCFRVVAGRRNVMTIDLRL
ncbi:MAG TPA: serine/threonine protein kinase [Myxococcales bacterium]|nr:serine/threonine protein kinase [Myxococcales bacterium]HIN86762.1 serine/threonine protein kinase [Myxococcales bacterium]